MAFELVVLDLDGVVLDDAMRVDPALEDWLRRAMARGLRATLATGRMPRATRPYWERFGISTPVILYNGALVHDPESGEALHACSLPVGLVAAIYPFFAGAPVDPLFFQGDTLYCLKTTGPVLAFCRDETLDAIELDDPETFLREGSFAKALFIGDPEALPGLREKLGPAVGAARLVVSRPDYLELLPPGASKGAALTFLAGRLGIPLESVIAVWDHENDLEMLQIAGVGIAMPHSPPHVRAAASYVAPPPPGGLTALLAELCPARFRPD